MTKMRDIANFPGPRKSKCAVCGKTHKRSGYFCSAACDVRERTSRVAHKLVGGLRLAVSRWYNTKEESNA